jgi:hypothetical protein
VPLIAEAWADQRIDGKMLPHISVEDLKEDVQISSGAAYIPAPVPTRVSPYPYRCNRPWLPTVHAIVAGTQEYTARRYCGPSLC